MRRVLFALVLVVLVGANVGAAMADPSGALGAPATSSEGLPLRLGKAAVFAIVVSALLVGGRMWRRGRRRPGAPG